MLVPAARDAWVLSCIPKMRNWLKLLVINDDRCLGASRCCGLVQNADVFRYGKDVFRTLSLRNLSERPIGCVDTRAMDMQLVTQKFFVCIQEK